MPLPAYPLEMLQDTSETTATLQRINTNLPPALSSALNTSPYLRKNTLGQEASARSLSVRILLCWGNRTQILLLLLLLKGSIQPRPQLLAETHQAKARGKGHRALRILYETKCSGKPERRKRRKQANKKQKTSSLYKTLFKPQMQVTFIIPNSFFILLERPQLIKAEREFIQTFIVI